MRPTTKAEPHRDRIKVLLIEDNPQDEFVVRRLLEDAPTTDYELRSVKRQSQALEALNGDFDVCILDYDLGEYTAVELLSAVDTDELAGPVILLTGHDEFSLDPDIIKLGVSDFIAKSELLTNLLERTLRYARHRFLDQQQLNFLARHDPLTGLLNRHAFLQRMENWLQGAARNGGERCLLYIDLDGFKAVNDSWGHDTGDRVLRHAAQIIQQCLHSDDLVARYGGDEMVAAVVVDSYTDLALLSDKMLRKLRTPLAINNREIVITASIGMAQAQHAPDDASELIRLADHAMFAAKHAGRDTSRVFDEQISLAHRDRADLEHALRNALAADELHLVFQPIVDMKSGKIRSAEALARWTHPEHGPVSPAQFVPLAEECGLIRQLTEWSLDAALATLAQWEHSNMLAADFRLAVNISPPQLLDPAFPTQLETLLAKHQVDRHRLRLEITENFFVHPDAAATLDTLVHTGLSLALDDFGTGYSSLAMLSQLPLDTLKIDRSFVSRMGEDDRAVALIRALITLGHEMQLQVIAEGVETQAQQDQLVAYGCDIAQGYFYARPDSSDVFLKALAAPPASTRH